MRIRPFTEAEEKYSYTQSIQLQGQTGSIGYFRGNVDKSGDKFFFSWSDHKRQLKTEKFETELNEVIDSLRFKYEILKDCSSMERYIDEHSEECSFNGIAYTEYGVRIDTSQNAYLLRFKPNATDYDFYCSCYVTQYLDNHIKNAMNGIRFIDSNYNELFRIRDGGKIVLNFSNKEKAERSCRFIDEYHTEIDRNIFHICQFAEIMQKNGTTYEPKKSGHYNQLIVKENRQKKENEMEQTLEINNGFGGKENVQVTINTYLNNNSLYVGLITSKEGYPEPYGDVTVNLPSILPPYCAFVDTNNMPGVEEFLVKNNIAEPMGLSESSGFCTFPMYFFDPEKLREFNPDGLAAYEQANGLERSPQKKEKSR